MNKSFDIEEWIREFPKKLPEIFDMFMQPVPVTIFFIFLFVIWRKLKIGNIFVKLLYKFFKIIRVVIIVGGIILLASIVQHVFYSKENKKDVFVKEIEKIKNIVVDEIKNKKNIIIDKIKKTKNEPNIFNRYIFLLPDERAFFDPIIEDQYNKGLIAYREKKYQKAVGYFSKVLEISTEYAFPYCARGVAYAKLEQYQYAMSDFDDAISINFTASGIFNNRAIVQMKQTIFQGAKLDFNNAIYLNPNFSQLYINRGYYFYVIKDYEKAKEDWKEAILKNRNNTELLEKWMQKLYEKK